MNLVNLLVNIWCLNTVSCWYVGIWLTYVWRICWKHTISCNSKVNQFSFCWYCWFFCETFGRDVWPNLKFTSFPLVNFLFEIKSLENLHRANASFALHWYILAKNAGPREGRTQGWCAIPMETAHVGKGDAGLFLFSTEFFGWCVLRTK